MSPEDRAYLDWEALPGLFPSFAEPGRWLPLLKRHLALVEAAAGRTRVTSVPPGEAIRRHYAESLELFRIVSHHAAPRRLTDVGPGGGYPGMVIACVAPDVRVDLVEPLQKRARLLEEMAEELGLTNVHVHAVRAERAGRGELRDAADLVVARAVAALPELLEYTAPLATPGGILALPKGSSLDTELAAAGRALTELGCSVLGVQPMRPEISESVRVLLLSKDAPTPERYPRREGLPGKRPLPNQ